MTEGSAEARQRSLVAILAIENQGEFEAALAALPGRPSLADEAGAAAEAPEPPPEPPPPPEAAPAPDAATLKAEISADIFSELRPSWWRSAA